MTLLAVGYLYNISRPWWVKGRLELAELQGLCRRLGDAELVACDLNAHRVLGRVHATALTRGVAACKVR
jgi:hypothetical protein